MSLLKKMFGGKNNESGKVKQPDDSPVCKTEQELIEIYGGIALEKQSNLVNLIGELDWSVDMGTGKISFGEEFVFPFQILGTFSHSSETWLWTWANSASGIPESLLEHALAMKKCGENHKIDLLRNGQFDASINDLHLIGMIASGMFGSSGYYLADYGQGIMCVVIKSDEIDQSYENSHHAILTTFPQLISLFEMNHKNALRSYLSMKGYELKEEGDQLAGTKNGQSIVAEFDELSRLTKLNG